MSKFYAVAVGFNPGIYHSWEACSEQVNGYSRAKFKKFSTKAAAEDFLESFSISNEQNYLSSDDYDSDDVYQTQARAAKPVQRIYTDGSAHGNQFHGPRAGYGCYFGQGDPRNASVPLSHVERPGVKHTNQRAELHGVGHALRSIENDYQRGTRYLYEIYTDSRYAINSLEVWTPKWRSRGWIASAGHEVVNRDIIEDASDRLNFLRSKGVYIRLIHVRGHGDSWGNQEADRLANIAADND